jgi:hypothetical protein
MCTALTVIGTALAYVLTRHCASHYIRVRFASHIRQFEKRLNDTHSLHAHL